MDKMKVDLKGEKMVHLQAAEMVAWKDKMRVKWKDMQKGSEMVVCLDKWMVVEMVGMKAN